MKKRTFLVIAVLSTVALSLTGCSGLGDVIENALRMKPDYYKSVATGGPLEQRYTAYGDDQVDSHEFTESGHRYKVWYPSTLKSANTAFPAVVMANGSGIRYRAYEATFQHLASWGFVVIGDDVDSTATGQTVSLVVDRLRQLNTQPGVFRNKINMERIGVSGHSQGAVGAVNGITRGSNGRHFSSAYLASITSPTVIENMKLDSWRFDTGPIKIPVFIVAGTGRADSESISPLSSMLEVFDNLKDNGTTALARRKNTDHGEMLANADGYMTAWFRYTLLNDPQAAGVFVGAHPELRANTRNWQDVRLK